MLMHLYPELVAVPTAEIDEIWHNHILHTKNYMNDCNQIFGYYCHHTPSSGSKKERKFCEGHYLKTMRLYEEQFKESYAYALDITSWIVIEH